MPSFKTQINTEITKADAKILSDAMEKTRDTVLNPSGKLYYLEKELVHDLGLDTNLNWMIHDLDFSFDYSRRIITDVEKTDRVTVTLTVKAVSLEKNQRFENRV